MGRLTSDLIGRSLAFVNCLKQVELDLRGNKIPEIENLGVTEVRKLCSCVNDNRSPHLFAPLFYYDAFVMLIAK